MQLQTRVDIRPSDWKIDPQDGLLFVGSCFAENVGRRFVEDKFRATVNPYGVMYNPVSVLHTIEKEPEADVTIVSLGTNHVYREKATGEIVDNCRKRPQALFSEEIMSVDECYETLNRIRGRVIFTVSPIRYRKYGYHESQLSKATLLLAVDRLVKENPEQRAYFPSYEIMNDELRDYRFYKEDMLHPTEQAVDYIYERFAETYFSDRARQFVEEWRPIREALNHRPFDAESEEYRLFARKTKERYELFIGKYSIPDGSPDYRK